MLDIEISPTVATVWGLFNQNIAINQITGNSEVLCWSAKWLGEDTTYFSSIEMTSKKKMLKEVYSLLEEADAVVTYNGKKFDLKVLNKEFALQGWGPTAPYKSIDMLSVVRSQFRFTSNKLGYIAPLFGIGEKAKHEGHELWLNCMNPKSDGYKESWAIMEKYNVQDVNLLEALYVKLKGWVPNHPSYSVYENTHVCPNCGSSKVQKRGTDLAKTKRYQRYKCTDCGKWSRSNIADKQEKVELLVGIR